MNRTTATHEVGSGSVLVLGGGLAGIAAAVRLARAGVGVTLLETRKRLGGRATSFVDPVAGRLLDNCQHVLLGCCTQLIDLYRCLGVLDKIRWHKALYFSGDDGRVDVLEADDLPAPLHLTRSVMSFRLLNASEKLAIARAMTAMLGLGEESCRDLDRVSFGDWLTEHGQGASVIRKFWSVVVTSALNELPERVSARYGIQVFREGFLANEGSYTMGVPDVPLAQLYDRAEQAIVAAGGRVMLGTGVASLSWNGVRVTSIQTAHGEEYSADRYISALPFDRLAKVCPESMRQADSRFGSLDQFEVSPILGIHLWLALPEGQDGGMVMDLPHLVLTDSPLHWIFNKGVDEAVRCQDRPCQHLHAVVSAAYDLVDQPAESIIQMAWVELSRALVNETSTAPLRPVYARVIKEKRATISVSPGTDASRPSTRGLVSNLYLAGDWVCNGLASDHGRRCPQWQCCGDGRHRRSRRDFASRGGGPSPRRTVSFR